MSSEKTSPSSNKATCLILYEDDPYHHIFDISLENVSRVYQLQEKIKAARPRTLAKYDHKDLNLWKVEVPFTDEVKMKMLEKAHNDITYDVEMNDVLGGELLEGFSEIPIFQYPDKINILICINKELRPIDDETLIKEMQNLNIAEVKATYPAKALSFGLAIRTGFLREGYQIEYHGKTGIFDGKLERLVMNGKNCKSFKECVIAVYPSITNVNDHHYSEMKINGLKYHEYRTRVFFTDKVMGIINRNVCDVISTSLLPKNE